MQPGRPNAKLVCAVVCLCCGCFLPAVTRVVSGGHVNVQVNILTKVCVCLCVRVIKQSVCATDVARGFTGATKQNNLCSGSMPTLSQCVSLFVVTHLQPEHNPYPLCAQDMAAFGYSDGSNRDQGGSVPVQL